jgi:hypothetical protein
VCREKAKTRAVSIGRNIETVKQLSLMRSLRAFENIFVRYPDGVIFGFDFVSLPKGGKIAAQNGVKLERQRLPWSKYHWGAVCAIPVNLFPGLITRNSGLTNAEIPRPSLSAIFKRGVNVNKPEIVLRWVFPAFQSDIYKSALRSCRNFILRLGNIGLTGHDIGLPPIDADLKGSHYRQNNQAANFNCSADGVPPVWREGDTRTEVQSRLMVYIRGESPLCVVTDTPNSTGGRKLPRPRRAVESADLKRRGAGPFPRPARCFLSCPGRAN